MSNKQHIYFIGIGGIGISGLAQIYLEKGFQIAGSDLNDSDLIQNLLKRGMEIKIGPHRKENLPPDIDQAVYNLAIPEDNPELVEAQKHQIKCLTYPEALGEFARNYFTICVAGTHGKTTTTGMISQILITADLDPTIIIGSKLKELGNTNYRLGKSKYLIIEADEYKRAFLNYQPDLLVITNIEADHLDYYQDLNDIQSAFKEFTKKLKASGVLITNPDIISLFDCSIVNKIIDYQKIPLGEIKKVIQIPGLHNLQNAKAAFCVGQALGIKDEIILKALSKYHGAWRRFEIKYDQGVTIIDDYGHHPSEIKSTLQAAREKYPNRRIWCVYQPHQIQRTEKLFSDFSQAFTCANQIIITKIFNVAGREIKGEARAINLAQKLSQAISAQKSSGLFLESYKQIINYLTRNMQKDDVIIIMGAGDINLLTPQIIESIKK